MDIPLDEVVLLEVITSSPSTGAASDADSTPSYEVFEEITDTAILSGSFTKRTSKTGDYRAQITLSAANGFEAGKWYSAVASATVSSVAAKCVAKHFRVIASDICTVLGSPGSGTLAGDIASVDSGISTVVATTDLIHDAVINEVALIKAKTDQLTFGVANTLNCNVTHGGGTAWATANFRADLRQVQGDTISSYVFSADLVRVDGANYDLSQAQLGVVVIDKTGFKLASDGLDSIDDSELSAGYPNNFRKKLKWLISRWLNKTVLDSGANTLTVYNANGTAITEQPATETASVQTIDEAETP